MSALIKLVHVLAGLFVDDGSLTLATLGIVALAALLALLAPSLPLLAGAILLAGCLIVLFTNAIRFAQRNRVR